MMQSHHPRKRFGQHFLCDHDVITHIIAAIAPQKSEHLIEIGPGQGALTYPLLRQLKHLEVIELDRDLIFDLEMKGKRFGDLKIHVGDVLQFDFATVKQDKRLLRLIGNLPYNISTPLIFHLLTYTNIISDMTFMLQKEVAERLAAQPSTDAYGRLSVMVQYHAQVTCLFDVPPSAFFPPPKVQSTVLRIVPHHEMPQRVHDANFFAEVVKNAFSQRRKTLRNSLRAMVHDDEWEKLAMDSSLRAENLSVQDYVALTNKLLAIRQMS